MVELIIRIIRQEGGGEALRSRGPSKGFVRRRFEFRRRFDDDHDDDDGGKVSPQARVNIDPASLRRAPFRTPLTLTEHPRCTYAREKTTSAAALKYARRRRAREPAFRYIEFSTEHPPSVRRIPPRTERVFQGCRKIALGIEESRRRDLAEFGNRRVPGLENEI